MEESEGFEKRHNVTTMSHSKVKPTVKVKDVAAYIIYIFFTNTNAENVIGNGLGI